MKALGGMVLIKWTDHAVSASTVYLVRSLGSVWGVAITASIVQNTLSSRLPHALTDIPNKDQVCHRPHADEVRKLMS